MFSANSEQELADLQKRMVRVGTIDSAGTVLLVMGVLGKFADNFAIHPILKSPNVTTGMIVAGGVIMAWGAVQIVAITRQRGAIRRELAQKRAT